MRRKQQKQLRNLLKRTEMDKPKIFRQVFTKDRLPEKGTTFLTEKGKVFSFDLPRCEWWLEEITLPTDDEILAAVLVKQEKDQTQFMRGIDYIMDKLKGGDNV